MAQLAASIVSHDDEFKRQVARAAARVRRPDRHRRRARTGVEAAGPDVVVVDIRADASSGMAAIERLRAGHPDGGDLRDRRRRAEPDLILQAMRAGANEFFPWQPGGATPASRAMEESFHGAVRRTAARRDAATAGARQPCVTHVFLGAKGGAGTTTVAVNCAVELARLTKRPTVDPRPQAVSRRGRAVPRRAAAVHGARRDREPASPRQGLPARSWSRKHKSGARHPRRLRAVRSPERAGRRRDRGAAARPGHAPTTTSSSTPAT